MGVQERKLREKEELRQEILDAAGDLFVRDGYEAVSMRKIADRIEYSPTTIYLHFRDKEELFDCLCEETFAKLDRKLQSIDKDPDDPIEGLRRGLRAYVEFGLKHPNHYRITLMTPHAHPEASEGIQRRMEAGCRAFEHLKRGVAACFEKDVLAGGSVEVVSQALWCGVHGVTSLLIAHPDFPWVGRTELIDHVIDSMIEGFRRR